MADDVWQHLLHAAIVIGTIAMLYATVKEHVFASLLYAAREHAWFRLIEKPSLLWALMGTSMVAFRTILWFRYRDFPTIEATEAKPLTVIIPAYNEGPMVAKSIDSVAGAQYPRHLLEIIVVDDGSRDDTWEHIQTAAARHPDLVKSIRFSQNKGKRAALAEGFRLAKGEYVVPIDSDSVINRNTLLAITSPFTNPKIGAVAGKVIVYNRRAGFIARMLNVRFVISFDFLRAAQSTYGIVYCCPGALAAYRISVVREVLDQWMTQKFLGVDCTYGEDRAMTNFILGMGYKTVYQRSAVVHTIVPVTYTRLCKMFLRWDRSYIREEFHFARIFVRQPFWPRLIAFTDVTLTNLRYPMTWISLALLAVLIIHDPTTLVRIALAIGVMSLLNVLYYLRHERSWDFVYGILYSYYAFLLLIWIFPYALLTVRARSWMTR